ncbi:MAG: signal transduction protein [Herbaspirillum sp.]|jgi:EAL and modified HD-GYP domain-containing signal transduction protein|nr:signal transduction protein [Herbaspirillum sp.]
MLTPEMAVQNISSSPFPLVFLEPIADVNHQWAALAIHLSPSDGDTTALLNQLFSEFEFHAALGNLRCLLPVPDPASFETHFESLLPPSQFVLRVPVEYCAGDAQLQTLDRLHRRGYAILVQGLPVGGATLTEAIAGISVDYTSATFSQVKGWLSRAGAGLHLAEEIQDQNSFDACQQLGFRWFSGEYSLHRTSLASRRDPTSRMRLLRLLDLVASDVDSHEIEQQMKHDPTLTYQLFKLVSSAAFGFNSTITNYTQALNLLGRRQLQRWLQLLLYARHASDKSNNPLLPRAAARAGLMEALCQKLGCDRDEQDRAFIVGMFSLLSVLLSMPMLEIIGPLKLPSDVLGALTERRGRLGSLLRLVERSEYGEAPLRHADLSGCGLTVQAYCHSLVHAYRWASHVSAEAHA